MTNRYENAPTIPPIVGERMIMRNGKVTETIKSSDFLTYPFGDGLETWNEQGQVYNLSTSDRDIVARYIAPTALTENKIAHGLLDPDTRAAMEAWEHGWEHLTTSSGSWVVNRCPAWSGGVVYRAIPAPELVNEVRLAQEPLTSDEIRQVRELLKDRGNV